MPQRFLSGARIWIRTKFDGGDRRPGRKHKRVRQIRIRRDQATVPARLGALFLYAPETECIGKGKTSAPYEFGVKVSIVTTNARAPGRSVRAACQALSRNPYDSTPCATSSAEPENSPARSSGPMSTGGTAVMTRKIHAVSSSRTNAASSGSLKKCDVAPRIIGHLKAEGHLGRCYL